MKSRSSSPVRATVFAALVILGFSLGALRCGERRRAEQRQILDEAVRTWEDEGGMVVVDEEDEDVRPAHA